MLEPLGQKSWRKKCCNMGTSFLPFVYLSTFLQQWVCQIDFNILYFVLPDVRIIGADAALELLAAMRFLTVGIVIMKQR